MRSIPLLLSRVLPFLPFVGVSRRSSNSAGDHLKMNIVEFSVYNRLAVKMDYFHDILRSTWNEVYAGATSASKDVPASRLIGLGLHFCDHLKGHHDIEETLWYPILANRMEGFGPGHFAREQHKEINSGLTALRTYFKDCQTGKRDFQRHEVQELMDSLGKVLWHHLDEEVKELGAENMKKYWTADEMESFPF